MSNARTRLVRLARLPVDPVTPLARAVRFNDTVKAKRQPPAGDAERARRPCELDCGAPQTPPPDATPGHPEAPGARTLGR